MSILKCQGALVMEKCCMRNRERERVAGPGKGKIHRDRGQGKDMEYRVPSKTREDDSLSLKMMRIWKSNPFVVADIK